MYIRFLPGTLPPLYQELQVGWTSTVGATNEVVCARSTHAGRRAIPGLHLIELAWFERPHLPRQRVGRRALEHRKVSSLPRHDRNQLHAG